MSMSLLTLIQVSVVFLVYTFMTIALPFSLLEKKMKGMRLVERIMLSYVFGNFYIINLVFVLQLLHISHQITLILGTIIPYVVACVKLNKIDVKKSAGESLNSLHKMVHKELGVKSVVSKYWSKAWRSVKRLIKSLFMTIVKNPIDVILFLVVTAIILWIYGVNVLQNFGYCASDIPVHNYWINYLSKGELFVAGVYPFGFHCLIYYIHEVFGLQTFVLLRVFCLVQTIYIHWMLLMFLKASLKSKYIAYLGVAIYAGTALFQYNTYSRYSSSLPQEFGMIFILPAIYFGFAFFKYKKEEEKLKANWSLVGFAMNFSLTLAVHFYDTMIAGIFCVAMAIAFFFRLFRKKYFGRVVITCVISVMTAVLPMGIAYATGTPLQGSLGWGMNIISGEDEEEEEEEEEEAGEAETDTETITLTETTGTEGGNEPSDSSVEEGGNIAVEEQTVIESKEELSLKEKGIYYLKKIKAKAMPLLEKVSKYLYNNILQVDEPYVLYSIYGSMALLLLLSLVYFIGKQADYGARLVTVAVHMMLMSILLISGALGLPTLMDVNRTSIYYAYCLPVLWCFAIDAFISLFFGWTKRKWLLNITSLLIVGVVSYGFISENIIKTRLKSGGMELNENIICTTNILKDYEDFTWTICSANDELRMTEDYGYHYETITFLKECESIGRRAKLTIPTEYVFFYVEKIPVDYAVKYANSGQEISAEGAARELPRGSGLGPYQGENRWIVMSKMYYWCEAFMEMYPEDMTVYFEDEKFICYRLKQNVFSLYELGIDYGYNTTFGFYEPGRNLAE